MHTWSGATTYTCTAESLIKTLWIKGEKPLYSYRTKTSGERKRLVPSVFGSFTVIYLESQVELEQFLIAGCPVAVDLGVVWISIDGFVIVLHGIWEPSYIATHKSTRTDTRTLVHTQGETKKKDVDRKRISSCHGVWCVCGVCGRIVSTEGRDWGERPEYMHYALYLLTYTHGDEPSLKHAFPSSFASRLFAGSTYALLSSSFCFFRACMCVCWGGVWGGWGVGGCAESKTLNSCSLIPPIQTGSLFCNLLPHQSQSGVYLCS